MKRHTLVIEGGQLGAVLAVALAKQEGLCDTGWYVRQDGTVQVMAHAELRDHGARHRWAKACRRTGLTVQAAPWERGK